jgi:hypothetical protein
MLYPAQKVVTPFGYSVNIEVFWESSRVGPYRIIAYQ